MSRRAILITGISVLAVAIAFYEWQRRKAPDVQEPETTSNPAPFMPGGGGAGFVPTPTQGQPTQISYATDQSYGSIAMGGISPKSGGLTTGGRQITHSIQTSGFIPITDKPSAQDAIISIQGGIGGRPIG